MRFQKQNVVFESQIPLLVEACLRFTPRHLFIDPFWSMNRDHRLSTSLTFTFYQFWDRSGQCQNVLETEFVLLYLHICAVYLRKHVWIPQGHTEVLPSKSSFNHFQSNIQKRAASLHISLRTEQKMVKRQKDRQKTKRQTKDKDTNAQRQLRNTAQIVFGENLWCLTQTPQILTNLWCLAQTPQILVKIHRF